MLLTVYGAIAIDLLNNWIALYGSGFNSQRNRKKLYSGNHAVMYLVKFQFLFLLGFGSDYLWMTMDDALSEAAKL